MKTVSVVAALLVSLVLTACGNEGGPVTERHISMANEKCEVNGGLSQVERADKSRVFESCGYRCSRATNQSEYRDVFSCKNGARFDLTWQE